MSIIDKIGQYFAGKGVKRAAHAIAATVFGTMAAWLTGPKTVEILEKVGILVRVADQTITITISQMAIQAAIVLLSTGAYAYAVNYLKFKTGIKWLQ